MSPRPAGSAKSAAGTRHPHGPVARLPLGRRSRPAVRRGATTCMPLKFVELSTDQNYLGAPLAVAECKVFMASTDNISGRTLLYAIGLTG
jgi:hypothetical protein